MATISTTPKPTYVYDTTTDTWYPVGSVALANMRTFEYFAAQGQTVFTGADSTGTVMAYTVGGLIVSLNGLVLNPGDDYTATDGATITLSRAASLNDTLVVNTFSKFSLPDAYSRAEANTTFAGQAQLGNRNLLHNGAFSVHQRSTSSTGITTSGYFTADRWQTIATTPGTWTQTIENDAPTGSGFRKSLRMLCTAADSSPAAGDQLWVRQMIEGQDVQRIKNGTTSAEPLTLSFWVKSNVTGTYVVGLWNEDDPNRRIVSAQYTISASNTWERKIVTFPADMAGAAFDNDSNGSLEVHFWLVAGSTYSSGTLATTWANNNNANRAVGQTNVASSINNTWQLTGVQLEVGTVATPFEFEDYGTTLAKCQRYFRLVEGLSGIASTSSVYIGHVSLQPPMRTSTTASLFDTSITISDDYSANFTSSGSIVSTNEISAYGGRIHINGFSGLTQARFYGMYNGGPAIALSADL